MNLKHLTDTCLLADTKILVQRERALLSEILHHLREIERRRLFAPHSSITEYAIRELLYSEDQAYFRISAMRMMVDLPAIQPQIEAGQINLTQISLAKTLFKSEAHKGTPLDAAQKIKVFERIAGLSKNKTQKILASYSGEPARTPDSIKGIGMGRNLVTAEFRDETLNKMRKLRGLLAHVDPNLSINDLFDRACDLAIERLNPARPIQRKVSQQTRAAVRRAVWARDGGACTRCSSSFAIEEDHVVPKSMGGAYTLENIRLLCRACNQRAGIEKLGLGKMTPYLARTATA
jgi:hypothetical protein